MAALDAIGYVFGAGHIELKLTAGGPKLIEVNCRPAGDRITHLLGRALEVDPTELLVEMYLGTPPDPIPEPVRGAAIVFLPSPGGRVVAVEGLERARAVPGVEEVSLYVGPGDVLAPPTNNNDRLGYVTATGADSTAALAAATRAAESILVAVLVPDGRPGRQRPRRHRGDPPGPAAAAHGTARGTGTRHGTGGRPGEGEPRVHGGCTRTERGLAGLRPATGILALAVHEPGYSTEVFGWLLTLNAVLVILVEVPLPRYTGHWQRRTPLLLGTVFICAGYAVNLAGISLPVLVVGVLSWTLGEVLMSPVASAFATEAAPPGREPGHLSFLSMCRTVGYAVGPAAGVYAYGQDQALPWLVCATPAVVSAPALYHLLPRAQWHRQNSEDCQAPRAGLGSVDVGDPLQGRRG